MSTPETKHNPWEWSELMAALRSANVFTGVVSSGAVRTVYTVPAGKRFVLKFLTMQEVTGTATVLQLRIGSLGTIAVYNLTAYSTSGSLVTASLWVVVNAGDTVQFSRIAAGDCSVTVNGSLLTI